ncbi:MAG: hypothetical protein ACOY33_12460 [Pseudomonadota bacterium]
MKFKALVAGMALGVVAGNALAAVDGSVGVAVPPAQASSSGNLIVSLTVPNIVRISNLNDIPLGTYAGVDMSGSDDVCVYRNITGNYRITADSTNGAGAFELEDAGNTSVIPYTVSWGAAALTENTALTGQTGAATTSTTCGGTPNVTVGVGVLATDIEAATVTGSHSDTLVLTLTSE